MVRRLTCILFRNALLDQLRHGVGDRFAIVRVDTIADEQNGECDRLVEL